MTQYNRRQWLRTAGLAGALTALGGGQLLQARPESRLVTTAGGASGELIRMSSNENPYGPSEAVRQAMTAAFDDACRYPYGFSEELIELIAAKEGVTPEHIVVTAGSTEGLRLAGLLYGLERGEIVAAQPTFLSLMSYSERLGGYVNWVPVDEQLNHDLSEMDKRITTRTSMVYVCNPNNPTGTILPARQLRDFCESVSKRTMVFADEAYYDFITEPNYPSMIKLVREGRNLIVARTFSKVYGLAGLRIGYLVARPDIAARFRDHMVAFTNVLALAAAKAALKDEAFYRFSLDKTAEAKQMIYAALDELGMSYQPSHTNFVFFESGREIRGLNADMREQGVLIGRPFPPFTDWCRISTGTIEETKQFCAELKKVMSS